MKAQNVSIVELRRRQEALRRRFFIFLCAGTVFTTASLALLLAFSAPSSASTGSNGITTEVIKEVSSARMINVLVPARRVEAGQAVELSMFKTDRRIETSLPLGAITHFEQIRGNYAKAILMPGEAITQEQLSNIKPANFVTANIPTGFRAVSISTNVTSSVEGWVRAGARVDVAWSSKIRGKAGITTIVQNALVLSAERQIDGTAPGVPVPSTVTLMVSEQDAAKIHLGTSTGALNLALRGDVDGGRGLTTRSITVEDLLEKPTHATDFVRTDPSVIKVRNDDGTMEEMVLINGRLSKKEG